jgi:hypothetical protein
MVLSLKYTVRMKKTALSFLLVIPILLFSQSSDNSPLTEKLFVGYVAGGINASQIAGDLIAGYDKVGGNLGVGAFIMYTQKFSNSIEIAYSMRGAQSTFVNRNPERFINYTMDYVQIPLMFNYHDGKVGIFQGGLTLGRLIRSKYIYHLNEVEVDATPWDLAFTGGLTFLIKENFGINMNATLSLTNNVKSPFVSPGNPLLVSRARNQGWYHNVIGLRMYYIFW